MNTLLIFFAFPVATVILAIVLQKVLKNPLLVAATFFAIYLIITFAFFDVNFLVYAVLYTILAYVTAVLARWICHLIKLLENRNNENCRIDQRPITINNTSPCNNINLANEATLLPASNANGRRINGNCGCTCRCGHR